MSRRTPGILMNTSTTDRKDQWLYSLRHVDSMNPMDKAACR
uniref:Uncharacterized protein n=1 Tax=Arundo donax TaxID=35708 RepID=A0A0A9DCD7_ARUDO